MASFSVQELQSWINEDFAGALSFCYGLSQQRVGFASHVVCEVSCKASEASGTHQGLAEQLTAAGLCSGQQCVLELRSSPSIGEVNTMINSLTLDGGTSKHSAQQVTATVALAQFLASLQGGTSEPVIDTCALRGIPSRSSLAVHPGSAAISLSEGRVTHSSCATANLASDASKGAEEAAAADESGQRTQSSPALPAASSLHSTAQNRWQNGKSTLHDRNSQSNLVPEFHIPQSSSAPQSRQLGLREWWLHPWVPHSLADHLRSSKKDGDRPDDGACRLLLYQLLTAVHALHTAGCYHGRLQPEHVLLTAEKWVWLSGGQPLMGPQMGVPPVPLPELTQQWRHGKLSNMEYLLHLNRLAGRRAGSQALHPLLPWILDMSAPPESAMHQNSATDASPPPAGWRDLSRSKWRLAKGDEQLDFTFASSHPPHHISDEALSELALLNYKARRLPKALLTKAVRTVFVGGDYPASLARLYAWTPDESIPEFYTDPQIFHSLLGDLPDLEVPEWAADAADFVTRHRAALESNRVSSALHQWIDLTFGYQLSGEAAVQAKNVQLPQSERHQQSRSSRVQLFDAPHPIRLPLHRQTPNEDAAVREKSNSSTADALRRLSVLESSSSSSSYETPNSTVPSRDESGMGSSMCFAELQAGDVSAIGRIAVQLFSGRPLHASPEDDCFWEWQIKRLPHSVQPFLQACMQPVPSIRLAALLLASDFFGLPVRAAFQFLASAQPALVTITDASCGAMLGQLAQRVASGELAALASQSEALHLVLPAIISRLEYAASANAHPATGRNFQQVIDALPDLLPRQWLEDQLIPLVADTLRSGVLTTQRACLSISLLRKLRERTSLPAFLREILPAVLDVLRGCEGGHRSSLKSSNMATAQAVDALCKAAEQLPVPVVLEHIVRPVLLSLGCGPHAAVALVRIGGSMGGELAGKHLLEPLLRVLASSGSSPAEIQTEQLNTGGDGQRDIATAMLSAITALEGLLPLLPPNAVLVHVIGPTLSPDGLHTVPTVPVQLLLAPDVHTLASPQLLNRVAGLLLQASRVAGGQEAFCVELLPQLLPILTCPPLLRSAYGSSHPTAPSIKPEPDGISVDQAAAGDAKAEDERRAKLQQHLAAALHTDLLSVSPTGSITSASANHEGSLAEDITVQESSDTDAAEDSAYWDLVYILYPEAVELAGVMEVHDTVPTWLALESVLTVRFGWKPLRLPPSTARSTAPWAPAQQAIRPGAATGQRAQSEFHRALSRGRGTPSQSISTLQPSVPPYLRQLPTAKSAGPPADASETDTLSVSSEARLSEQEQWSEAPSVAERSGREWLWLESGSNMVHQNVQSGRGSSTSKGCVGDRPWKLKAAVVHKWRAHRERMRAMAVSGDESTVVTAGRGLVNGRDAEVVRCWRLSDGAPGAQYTSHGGKVRDVAALPASELVASRDQGGAIHVWSTHTGACAAAFTSPESAAAAATTRLSDNLGMATSVGWHGFKGSKGAQQYHLLKDSCSAGAAETASQFGKEAGKPSAALNIKGSRGFTCMAVAQHSTQDMLVAGTASGQLMLLDIELQQAGTQMLCTPPGQSQIVSAVEARGRGGGERNMLVAGLSGGHASLLDARAGQLVCYWAAHSAGVTAAMCWEHQLVTASQDSTLKVWDLRMMGSSHQPQALVTITGHKHGILAVARHGVDVLSISGSRLGVVSLQVPFTEHFTPVRLAGGRDGTSLVDLAVLPCSRLVLTGTADGLIQICA